MDKIQTRIFEHDRIMVIILLLLVIFGAYLKHAARATIEQKQLYKKQLEKLNGNIPEKQAMYVFNFFK